MPTAIIAAWGSTYVYSCVLTLTSSSVPVVLRLKTPGGIVTMRAQSFQYDLHKNYLHATQAVLIDPDGERLIEIDEIQLFDLVPGKKTITGTARGITGKIDRGRDRKWKFLDYFPKTDGEASDIAFSLVLRDVSVKVTDYAGRDPLAPSSAAGAGFSRWVATTEAHVDGVGDDLVVSGPIRLEGVGTSEVAFRKQKEGLWISGRGRMELAPVIDWLRAAPEGKDIAWLPDFRVRRLTADGPWDLTYIDEKVGIHVPGRATFDDVAFGEYRASSGEVQGTLTETGFDGYANAIANGASARFEGRIRWEDEVSMAGRLEGNAQSVAALPAGVRSSLPKGTAFSDAKFAGWLAYDRGDISFLGSVEANAIRYEQEEFRGIRAKIDVTPASATVGISEASYLGQPLTGAIQVIPDSKELRGFVTAKRVILEPVLKRFGFDGLRGQGEVTAMLSGTTDAPVAIFAANGQAKSTLSGSLLDLGDFTVRGTYAKNRVTLDRSGIKGPAGSAYASGVIDLTAGKLNLELLASDFPLEAVTKEVSGAATFRGTVRGDLKSPVASGGAEVYNLRVAGQEIPVGFADILADAKSLTAKNLVAIRGGSRVQGEAGIRWKDQSLFGSLSAYGIQAKDWFPEQIAGIVDVTNANLGGTLASPTLTALLTGSNLVVPGMKLDSVRGAIQYADGSLRVTEGEAKVGAGTITASGEMGLESKSGTFAIDIKDLPLGRLLFDAATTLNVSGTLTAKGMAELEGGELKSITSKGSVADVALNEAVLGSGDLAANYANGVWSGNALIGQLDSYLEVPRFSLTPAKELLEAEFTMNNEPLSKLTAIAKRYGESSIPEGLMKTLERLDGTLDFNGTTSGKWTNPILESKAFSLSDIQIDGVNAGTISSEFSRVDGLWTIASLTWDGPEVPVDRGLTSPSAIRSGAVAGLIAPVIPFAPLLSAVPVNALTAEAQNGLIQAKFEGKGTVDEHGETHVTGSLNNLLARSLAVFVPGIEGLDGVFNMPYFQVEGPTKSPVIEASLGYRDSLVADQGSTRSVDVTTTIREGLIEAAGLYQLNGFTGPIEARIPFRYPFAIAETEDIQAKITLPQRNLTDLQELWPTLDPARTSGAVQGEITVSGRPDALRFAGSARLIPEEGKGIQVADKALATYLKDLDAAVLFDGQRLSLSAQGSSSDGGTFSIKDVGVGLGDVFGAMLSGDVESFYANALSGRVELNQFKVAYNDKTAGPITGSMSGGVDLKGTVGQPLIEGDLIVDEGNLAVPTLTGTGASGEFNINPSFNLSINTAQPIRFRAGTGSFDLTGTAAIKGSLETPDMSATLTTRRGSIRLPNARISIEEGGLIRITYRTTPTGIVASRADLEMEGRTQVTAERFGGGGVERYDVFLTIRGNILEDQGLILTARSDPPDLSQDRILALLGQGDFLRSISINALSPTEQLRSALVGLALPYLAGSITDKIAATLGLDYINVEYSSFDRVTVTAAISLTRDLVLSGRRQISNPLPGERPKYDIRLSYRPRFAGKSLSRLSFSIGMDQDRPWKIGVEYGIKF